MTSEIVRLACRWFDEVWNQRRTETIDELLTDESLNHSEMGVIRGRKEFRERSFDVITAAFPDLRLTILGTIADDDQVVVRWLCKGTHLGDGLGFPATGRTISFKGMTWVRFEGGKLVEGWDFWNRSRLIQSLLEPMAAPSDQES